MRGRPWSKTGRITTLEAESNTLRLERDEARRELDRVVAQRDELRRVIGNVRSYARQEVARVVMEHTHTDPPKFPDGSPRESSRVVMRPTVALAAHLNDPEPPQEGIVGLMREVAARTRDNPPDLAGELDRQREDHGEPPVHPDSAEAVLPPRNRAPGVFCSCVPGKPSTWSRCPVHAPGRAVHGEG